MCLGEALPCVPPVGGTAPPADLIPSCWAQGVEWGGASVQGPDPNTASGLKTRHLPRSSFLPRTSAPLGNPGGWDVPGGHRGGSLSFSRFGFSVCAELRRPGRLAERAVSTAGQVRKAGGKPVPGRAAVFHSLSPEQTAKKKWVQVKNKNPWIPSKNLRCFLISLSEKWCTYQSTWPVGGPEGEPSSGLWTDIRPTRRS